MNSAVNTSSDFYLSNSGGFFFCISNHVLSCRWRLLTGLFLREDSDSNVFIKDISQRTVIIILLCRFPLMHEFKGFGFAFWWFIYFCKCGDAQCWNRFLHIITLWDVTRVETSIDFATRVPGYSLQWISSLTNTAGLPTSTFFVYFSAVLCYILWTGYYAEYVKYVKSWRNT